MKTTIPKVSKEDQNTFKLFQEQQRKKKTIANDKGIRDNNIKKIPEVKIGYIYVRVSTYKQASMGCSLEVQRNLCEKKAEELDIRVAGIFSDEGVSGRNFERKGLSKLKKIIQPGEFIITHSLSRLGRRTSETTKLYEDMQNSNIQIISISEPFINDPKFGKFVATLMASINEMEVEETMRRTEAIISDKKANGEQTGPVGYGFELHHSGGRKYLYPNVHEQRGITYAITNRSYDPPTTYSRLAKEMASLGWVPRRAKKWTHSSLERLVEGNIKKRATYDHNALSDEHLIYYEKHRIPINLDFDKIIIDEETGLLDYRKVYGIRYDKENNEIPSPEDIQIAIDNGKLALDEELTKEFEEALETPTESASPAMTPELQEYLMKLMASGQIPLPP